MFKHNITVIEESVSIRLQLRETDTLFIPLWLQDPISGNVDVFLTAFIPPGASRAVFFTNLTHNIFLQPVKIGIPNLGFYNPFFSLLRLYVPVLMKLSRAYCFWSHRLAISVLDCSKLNAFDYSWHKVCCPSKVYMFTFGEAVVGHSNNTILNNDLDPAIQGAQTWKVVLDNLN